MIDWLVSALFQHICENFWTVAPFHLLGTFESTDPDAGHSVREVQEKSAEKLPKIHVPV